MTRILLRIILLVLCLNGLSGCAYVHIKTPYDTDLHQTTLGEKEGKASYQSWLSLFMWGDAGTAAAAKNGGITTITHMDRQTTAVLFGFLYYKSTTIIYGN